MAATQTLQPVITPFDRLGLTLSLTICLHAALILGITFVEEDRPRTRFDTMEIVMVQQSSPKPQEAELLSQANLEGGGNVEESINPTTPMPAPFPDPEPQITNPPPIAEPETVPETAAEMVEVAEPEPIKQEQVETLAAEDNTMPEEAIIKKVETPSTEKKVVEKAEIVSKEDRPQPLAVKKPVKKEIDRPPLPSATQLLTNSFRIASLSAEIRRKLEKKAKRPRRKFISATTKEYNYADAAYMNAWRSKVERVGNLNYPEQARQQNLSGSLILDVALNADGTINEITIRKSSGKKILDDAAMRIVELAAPYAAFPQNIKDETDILHIMRTWQFIDKKGFR